MAYFIRANDDDTLPCVSVWVGGLKVVRMAPEGVAQQHERKANYASVDFEY
jgi:hypothetical protein